MKVADTIWLCAELDCKHVYRIRAQLLSDNVYVLWADTDRGLVRIDNLDFDHERLARMIHDFGDDLRDTVQISR